MSFSLDFSKFAKRTDLNMRKTVIYSFTGVSKGIIDDTAVKSGRLRNSWFPAIDGFAKGVSESESKGNEVIDNVIALANKFQLGQTLTLTNNMDNAAKNEYGWYVPTESENVSGGFSKKSPDGMVGRNVILFQKWIDKNARRVR